jgi:hypothetical protein
MEPLTIVLVAVALVLAGVAATAARSRRDRSLEPTRLGPAWEHPGAADEPAVDPADDPRVAMLTERTDIAAGDVAVVLQAWDEHLAVLGFLTLPASHRYRVYDPYDPPIASRGPDNRPVADPVRVARDVAQRTRIAEIDARTVLDTLLGDDDDDRAAGSS